MIVDVSRNGQIKLLDVENFQRLSLQLPADSTRSKAVIDTVLKSLGSFEDKDHVWVDVAVLKRLGPEDDDWLKNFKVMVVQATKHGWTRTNGNEVRVHISRRA
jgi:hypothetical protein